MKNTSWRSFFYSSHAFAEGTISIIIVVLFSVFFSCEKESIENPSKGKLKRKLEYGYIQDTIPRSISEYQYDRKQRLVKIQNNHSTQLFEYNQNDELIRKHGYQIDGSGSSMLSDTTYYKYQNGQLVYEESFTLQPAYYPYTHQIKYEYENTKLVKKKEYQDHKFSTMTVYEYTNDLCKKEIHYSDSIVSSYFFYTDYIYDKGQLA